MTVRPAHHLRMLPPIPSRQIREADLLNWYFARRGSILEQPARFMSIHLATLGQLKVFKDEQEILLPVQRRVRAALLVYLAMERDVSREKIASVFWPDSGEDKARHALSQALYQLRQIIGEEDWLIVAGDRIRVPSLVQIDACTFEESVQAKEYDVALNLYGGPFLSGVDNLPPNSNFQNWADAQRAHLERLHRQARREMIAKQTSATNYVTAVATARDWIRISPAEDEAHHKLIELLAETGQRTEAVRHFESYERQLAKEDLRPLDETVALVASLRREDLSRAAEVVKMRRNLEDATRHDMPGIESDQVASSRPKKGRRAVSVRGKRALIGGLLCGVLAMAAFFARPRASAKNDELLPLRIAVLYFDDFTRNGDLSYLANSFTEAIIHELTRVEGLDVVSRTGVKPFRNTTISVDSIAKILNAGTLVEGSVESVGDQLRVTVQLVHGSTGSHILSEQLQGSGDDLLRLKDELVQKVALLLRRHLGREIELEHARNETKSERAWRAYARAEFQLDVALPERSGDERELALSRAERYYQEAAAIDPRWMEPRVGLAEVAYRRSRIALEANVSDDWIAMGLSALAPVFAADSVNARAFEVRGTLRYWRYLRLGNGLAPASAESLLKAGRSDLERAVRIDPTRARAYSVLSHLLYIIDVAAAVDAAKMALNADPYFLLERSGSDVTTNVLQRAILGSYDLERPSDLKRFCSEGRKVYPEDPRFTSCELLLLTMPTEPSDISRAWSLLAKYDSLTSASSKYPPDRVQYNHANALLDVAIVIARAAEGNVTLTDSARHVGVRARNAIALVDTNGYEKPKVAFLHTLLGDKQTTIRILEDYKKSYPEDNFAGHWWWRNLRHDTRAKHLF
jgi:DNA-binding SARP family transcriptional activator/TolB-like protein